MSRRAAALSAGLLLLIAAFPARAAAAPTVAVDFDGCATVVDTEKVLAELTLDLGADQLQPTAVVVPDVAPPDAMRLRVRCTDRSLEVILRIDAREPESVWLSDTSGGIRARTLALALAERVRQIRLEPPPAPPPPPAVVTAKVVAESARPRPGPFRNPDLMRMEGQIALALGGLTLAGFAAGAPIAAIGDANANRGDLRAAGAAVLGTSCGPLIATAVAFGLWMHERSLPLP